MFNKDAKCEDAKLDVWFQSCSTVLSFEFEINVQKKKKSKQKVIEKKNADK